MTSSNSPCAACKCLRRKCTQECVFAPYFPPDNPQKFTNVHKVFGASNVAKILNELNAGQREDAVNSLAYEAEYRLKDPVYGCVGLISILQHRLKQVQNDLEIANKELATYVGPSAMLPTSSHPSLQPSAPYLASPYQMMSYHQHQQQQQQHQPMMVIREPQEHQQQRKHFFEAQQMRSCELQQQQQAQPQNDLVRFNSDFEDAAAMVNLNITGGGRYNQIPMAATITIQPSLALANPGYDTIAYHLIHQQQGNDPH
ncbi:hypothetical protein M569_17113, partial [Genlisea aurea]